MKPSKSPKAVRPRKLWALKSEIENAAEFDPVELSRERWFTETSRKNHPEIDVPYLLLDLTPASKAAYVERCAKALWKWHWPTVPVGERGSLGMWKCRELAQTALASLSPHLKTKTP